VDIRFKAEEWQLLTRAERIRRCQSMAREAQELANKASDRLKPAYLELAVHWLTLAQEIEAEPEH
jgi:hypothetical protein